MININYSLSLPNYLVLEIHWRRFYLYLIFKNKSIVLILSNIPFSVFKCARCMEGYCKVCTLESHNVYYKRKSEFLMDIAAV